MKLAAISMIRDEADIIAPFLGHLAALFDIVFLFDQRSSDGSGELMRQACAARETWSYYLCDFAGRHQKEVSNVFLRKAFERGADALFFLDADEFIGVSSRAELEEAAAKINQRRALGSFRWKSCIPTSFDRWLFEPAAPLWVADANSPWFKVVISRAVFLSIPAIQVGAGNHLAVLPDGTDNPRTMPLGHLFHVPVRSHQQLLQKVFTSAFANLAKSNRMIAEGSHKRRLLEIIAERDLSDEVLVGIASAFPDFDNFELQLGLPAPEQRGFSRRTLDVPISDLSLRPLPRAELSQIIARCLRDFELEKLAEGTGSLQIEDGVIRYQRRPAAE
jgi:hypothetical protein